MSKLTTKVSNNSLSNQPQNIGYTGRPQWLAKAVISLVLYKKYFSTALLQYTLWAIENVTLFI